MPLRDFIGRHALGLSMAAGAGLAISQAHPGQKAVNLAMLTAFGNEDADNAILGRDVRFTDLMPLPPAFRVPQGPGGIAMSGVGGAFSGGLFGGVVGALAGGRGLIGAGALAGTAIGGILGLRSGVMGQKGAAYINSTTIKNWGQRVTDFNQRVGEQDLQGWVTANQSGRDFYTDNNDIGSIYNYRPSVLRNNGADGSMVMGMWNKRMG